MYTNIIWLQAIGEMFGLEKQTSTSATAFIPCPSGCFYYLTEQLEHAVALDWQWSATKTSARL
jgi:hypothetical protein